MDMQSLREQAAAARQDAESPLLKDYGWLGHRAHLYQQAAALFEKAGLTAEAEHARWDAQLWLTGTAVLSDYDGDEKRTAHFRPVATLVATDDAPEGSETGAGGSRLIHAGHPGAVPEEAKSYFGECLDVPCSPVITARYADFLFDQKYAAKTRRRSDYARIAVTSYLEVALEIFGDAELTLYGSLYLLRAADVARSMSQSDLIAQVSVVIRQALRQLRDQRRFRFVTELIQALVILGKAAERSDWELARRVLEEAARAESAAGSFLGERMYLRSLDIVTDQLKDNAGQRAAKIRMADLYVDEAKAHASVSHLVAASFLEDAARLYKQLEMPDRVDDILTLIRQEYQAGQGEYGWIEVQGEFTRDEVDQLYALLAPHSLEDALQLLGVHPAFQPSHAQAEEVARQVSRDAPLSFRIAHVIVRDDSPVRRMAEPDEIFRTQVQQQSVLAISIGAVVIGALLERLEKDKGLDARGLASYLARWPLMEPRHVPLLERGLERYYSGDYISALHILTPQVEGVLRSMLWQGGLTVTGFTRDGAGIQADTLSALLRREDVKESLGTEQGS